MADENFYTSKEFADKIKLEEGKNPLKNAMRKLSDWDKNGVFVADKKTSKGRLYLKPRVDALINFANGATIDDTVARAFTKSYSGNSETPTQALIPYAEFSPTKIPATLPQLELEIQHYLQQTAQNIFEVGRRLIAAKQLVRHGNWANWLKGNFDLSYRSAKNFMDIAERFSNLQTSANLTPSRWAEMLLLPAGDEEDFIQAKAAEGKVIADMTVKNLREEIKAWKNKDSDNAAEIARLEKIHADTRKMVETLTAEKISLEKKLADRQNETVTIAPADYDLLKEKERQLADANAKVADLQGKLDEVNAKLRKAKKPIERAKTQKVTPVDDTAQQIKISLTKIESLKTQLSDELKKIYSLIAQSAQKCADFGQA